MGNGAVSKTSRGRPSPEQQKSEVSSAEGHHDDREIVTPRQIAIEGRTTSRSSDLSCDSAQEANARKQLNEDPESERETPKQDSNIKADEKETENDIREQMAKLAQAETVQIDENLSADICNHHEEQQDPQKSPAETEEHPGLSIGEGLSPFSAKTEGLEDRRNSSESVKRKLSVGNTSEKDNMSRDNEDNVCLTNGIHPTDAAPVDSDGVNKLDNILENETQLDGNEKPKQETIDHDTFVSQKEELKTKTQANGKDGVISHGSDRSTARRVSLRSQKGRSFSTSQEDSSDASTESTLSRTNNK